MKVSQEILNLIPYQPGKPIEETQREYGLSKVYKLASNENPLGPSPMAQAAMTQSIKDLHRYPDGSSFQLKKVIAEKYAVAPEKVTFGNGSNELIDLLVRVFAEPGERILTSVSAFIAYELCAQAARVQIEKISLNAEMGYDIPAFIERLTSREKQMPRMIFIANPNNPTGSYINTEELTSLLEATKDIQDFLVVLDEAYNEFVRAEDYPNSIEMQKKYPHLVVLRTLSKVYGIAGLRIGWMLAEPELIDLVNRVRNPFNVNSLAQVGAAAALKDVDFLQRSQQVNWQGLDYFYKELERLQLKYWPSQGNFVLFDTGHDSSAVYERLLQKGVIMRPVKGYGLMTHLRLSVGLPEENQMAMSALEEVLRSI